jgi:geranylgeranyl reductase family protein
MSQTSTKLSYDVIVAGAGPAGCAAAHYLASHGVKTLMVEKETLPRYKPCGGGVNLRAAQLLPFDLSPIIERRIFGGEFSCRLGPSFIRDSQQPITYMTMRDRLDHFLCQQALSAGAGLLEESALEIIEEEKSRVFVVAGGHRLEAQFLVGADGATGLTSRWVGAAAHYWRSIAIELEVVPDDPTIMDQYENRVSLDVGTIPGGYAWTFPKGDHLSVGVGGPKRYAKMLRPYLTRFLASRKVYSYQTILQRGYTLPMRHTDSPLYLGRVILVGDAAGLVDPFSGEGIYPAIKSGLLAGEVLLATLSGQGNPGTYKARLEQELWPDYPTSALLAKLFSLTPWFYVNWLNHGQRPWRFACQLLQGERSYVDLQRKLGPLGIICPLSFRWNTLGW